MSLLLWAIEHAVKLFIIFPIWCAAFFIFIVAPLLWGLSWLWDHKGWVIAVLVLLLIITGVF